VMLNCTDGNQRLALGANSAPALFVHWKDATKFRRELREHGLDTGRIKRVHVIESNG
jgi:hypothetical protein